MRSHALVSPAFWTGRTGRALKHYPDAQRLALYLITCPSSNMIGLYYLPMPTLCHELGMTEEGASEALRRVFEGGFAAYEAQTETVFVHEMARFQVGEYLKPKDNRILAVEKQLEPYRKSRFYNEFLNRYGERFCLTKRGKSASPLEAPSKPLRSQDQEQDKEQENEEGVVSTPPPAATLKSFAAVSDANRNGHPGPNGKGHGGTVNGKARTPRGVPGGSPRGDATAGPVRPTPAGPDEPPGFASFWREWPTHPRKKGRSKCLRVWSRMGLERIAGQVLAALGRWKASAEWAREKGRFVPGPEPWLNDESWEVPPDALPPSDPDGLGGWDEIRAMDPEQARRILEAGGDIDPDEYGPNAAP